MERDPNRAGELYNQAAELAMATMKGKLANRYYIHVSGRGVVRGRRAMITGESGRGELIYM